MNIKRRAQKAIREAVEREAAIVLVGPRQIGKTTMTFNLGLPKETEYLDLEKPNDLKKMEIPLEFLTKYSDKLVILDEVHKLPSLFPELRGIIDEGRRQGLGIGRFMLLGSASFDILTQSGESLAGRIEIVELGPLDILEIFEESTEYDTKQQNTLWTRGGYPKSFLAESDKNSYLFRQNLIKADFIRDVKYFGKQIPANSLEKFWNILAHYHGNLINLSNLAKENSKSIDEINEYIHLLENLFFIRRLQPYSSNLKKRLVKSPKLYIRDSGMLHSLLGIRDIAELTKHPSRGASWEGFVIENLLSVSPMGTNGYFYNSSGAEIDLVLQLPGAEGIWCVEIKSGVPPVKPERGFYIACSEIKPDRKFLVHSGRDRFVIKDGITVIGLRELANILANL